MRGASPSTSGPSITSSSFARTLWMCSRLWSNITASPTPIPVAIPTYYVAKETRKHVTVALNGDGGDESFAGYERYAAMKLAESYRRLPGPLRRQFIERAIGILPSSELKRSRIRDLKAFCQGGRAA